jgi:hypothetical protein
MDSISLRNNLLFLLVNKFMKSGSLGPHQTELIYEKFSEISNEKVLADLELLQADGLVAMVPYSVINRFIRKEIICISRKASLIWWLVSLSQSDCFFLSHP